MDLVSIRMRLSGAREAMRDTRGVRDEMGRLRDEQGRFIREGAFGSRKLGEWTKNLKATGARMRSTGTDMTQGLTLPILGLGVAAAKTAIDFDKSMAQVGTALGASDDELVSLRATAVQFGKDTIYSANEAAQAMLELAKGGMTQAEIQGGALAATTALAAAGNIELAAAGNQVTRAMNTFGIKASKAKDIADALAGGANASSADLGDLSMSLSQAGQGAVAAGLDIHETVGVLAAFSDQGIAASDAGTSFKTFLQRLAPTSGKAKDLIQDLGLEFFNASGHMKSITAISRELQKGFSGMSQEERLAAMNTIFGSDASRAANIIRNQGAKGLQKYIKATRDQGAAQRMANAQMEGLPGAWERLKGSLETASLMLGEAMAPALEKVAGWIGEAADAFTNLDPRIQTIIAGGLGLIAVIGPLLVVGGVLATAIAAIGGSTLGVIAAVGAVIGVFAAATGGSEKFRDGVMSVVDAVKGFVSDLISGKGETGEFGRNMVIIGTKIKDVLVFALKTAVRVVGFLLPGIRTTFSGIAKVVGGVVKIVAGILTGDWSKVWSGAKDIVVGAIRAIKGVVQTIGGAFKAAFGGIKAIVSPVIDWIADKVAWVVDQIESAKDKLDSIVPGGGGGILGTGVGPKVDGSSIPDITPWDGISPIGRPVYPGATGANGGRPTPMSYHPKPRPTSAAAQGQHGRAVPVQHHSTIPVTVMLDGKKVMVQVVKHQEDIEALV